MGGLHRLSIPQRKAYKPAQRPGGLVSRMVSGKKTSGMEKTQGAETAPNSTTTTVANGGGGSQSQIESILKERFIKMTRRLLSESKTDVNAWNSDILLTANDNSGTPLFHIVISTRGDDVLLWVKPPTLRNGYPIALNDDVMVKLDKLINALQLLRNVLPDVMKELGISNSVRNRVNISNDRIEI